MRFGIIAAVALSAASASYSVTPAQAQEWCGYATRANSVIECGYTTVAECESAVGKGGMCFVDPETAALSRHRDPRSHGSTTSPALAFASSVATARSTLGRTGP